MKYRLRLEHEDAPESPNDWGTWKLISFNSRHIGYIHPDKVPAETIEAVKKGEAFALSYYEHGGSMWSLAGSGPSCQFDSVSIAGILVWEGEDKDFLAIAIDDRRKYAESFLSDYNKWANGQIYWFDLVTLKECKECHHVGESEDIDSCGGFYSAEDLFDHVRANFKPGDTVEVIGKASFLADAEMLKPAEMLKLKP